MRSAPHGERYPRVGGTRLRRFGGTIFKPRKLPENAQTPTRWVHTVLGRPRISLISCDAYYLVLSPPSSPRAHHVVPPASQGQTDPMQDNSSSLPQTCPI